MTIRRLKDVASDLRNGDVLLFRTFPHPDASDIAPSAVWRNVVHPWRMATARAGRSDYYHAEVVRVEAGQVFSVGMCWTGGRKAPLAELVEAEPWCIDVYRLVGIPGVICDGIAHAMLEQCGRKYPKLKLLRVAAGHLPIVRWFVRPQTMADSNGGPYYCSDAIAHVYRVLWRDLVPNLPDDWTEPGDLARSGLLDYQYTLEP